MYLSEKKTNNSLNSKRQSNTTTGSNNKVQCVIITTTSIVQSLNKYLHIQLLPIIEQTIYSYNNTTPTKTKTSTVNRNLKCITSPAIRSKRKKENRRGGCVKGTQ